MDRVLIDLNIGEILNSEKIFELHDGDKIQVFSVLEARQNMVSITGAITRPGTYDLGQSLRLSELIIKADSITGDAYLDRVDIIRISPDLTEELIKVNLLKALNGDLENDIKLKSLDRVKVYSTSDMIQKTYVSISGHVKNPGRYLLQKNMTLLT